MEKIDKLAKLIVCKIHKIGVGELDMDIECMDFSKEDTESSLRAKRIAEEIVEMENALTDAIEEIIEEKDKRERERERY